jgi:hypothetical protein
MGPYRGDHPVACSDDSARRSRSLDLPADLALTLDMTATEHRLSPPELVESSVRQLMDDLRREAQRGERSGDVSQTPSIGISLNR